MDGPPPRSMAMMLSWPVDGRCTSFLTKQSREDDEAGCAVALSPQATMWSVNSCSRSQWWLGFHRPPVTWPGLLGLPHSREPQPPEQQTDNKQDDHDKT